MKITVVYDSATLEVKDVFEGEAKFSGLASGLSSATIDADSLPEIGSTLASDPAPATGALKLALAAYCEKLNAKYEGLNLDSSTDTKDTAMLKLLALGTVEATECAALEMLYRQTKN